MANGISGASAAQIQTQYSGAVMKKGMENQKLEGKMALQLLDAAQVPAQPSSPGAGRIVNRSA